MHKATDRFWKCLDSLAPEVQSLARKNFELLKEDAAHPSLQLKKVGKFWSARVGLNYRALAVEAGHGYTWVWIGSHDDYDRLIG
ncbi:hypothetical protein [Cerasicoccus frondis]|uniref:ParE family toxin-like protein n=1 Tax=Cerasicoccus frondis TaxID=490090 RepID=UPI00285275A5|nr:hypothetical protein [Cerasicoccus frondis]